MPSQGTTSTRRRLQAQKAAAHKYGHPNEAALSRDYAAATLEDFIERTLSTAPPLTEDQTRRLAALLEVGGLDGAA